MTGSLDREKGLLYDASIHLRFGEGDMDQTGQNIIDAAMELVVREDIQPPLQRISQNVPG